MPSDQEVEKMLTGPNGAFETVIEEVNGIPMKVYKQRMKALREISALAGLRGDSQDFMVYGKRRIGFDTFVKKSHTISAHLLELGVGKSDRVAVLSANNPEWCMSFWGTVDAGAILVGLNGWWKTDEIIFGLKDSGAKVLIADYPRYKRIENELNELGDLKATYVINLPHAEVTETVRDFDELLEDSQDELIAKALGVEIDEDDPAVIFYTSGTTGRPKGAISTHRSMIANLQNTFYLAIFSSLANPGSGIIPSDGSNQMASLLTSPLFHVTGCHSGLVVGLASGIKLVMLEGKFESKKVLELIQEEKITVWTGVPTMIWRVVEDPDVKKYDLSSVRSVAYGGSPSGTDLQKRIRETFPNVKSLGNAYGLTESSSAVTINSGEGINKYPESVGRALPIVELKIVDEKGNDLGTNKIGEVLIKGPQIMPGYWQNEEATKESVRDGWLYSGDVGFINDEGYLTITDRAKDMIIRGGENVYCVEIENRLVDHPLIAEAAVIGVPHPTLGEEVKAIVHLEPGAHLSEQEVKDWVRETLADFKVPEYVEFTYNYLPRNPSGKILKNLLKGSGDVSFEGLESNEW
jgi:long-chain acyl-CoA synthetase